MADAVPTNTINIDVDISQALPTPLRLDADERFRGRNVTIAFLDSGFYAHNDLTEPVNRSSLITASSRTRTILRFAQA